MASRTLTSWLDYISSTHPSEIELGLGRIRTVFETLPLPEIKPKVVLVAGTNGKGSTVAMIEAGLLKLGINVGSYTSPHILVYNERVRTNGQNASDQSLVEAFEIIESLRGDIPLTYFEFATLAAIYILFNANVDVVLLEVGLGGRLDAVNVVDPDISIITSIGIDHADWLGDSIDKIGAEKAGILRSDALFIGGENLPDSVSQIAESLSCQKLLCREDFDLLNEGPLKGISLVSSQSNTQLSGFPDVFLPENNILISIQTLALLYEAFSPESAVFDQSVYEQIVSAINLIKLSGRLEKINHPGLKDFYIDVGHNPHAALYLKSFLLQHALPNKQVQIVYSSLVDKDVLEILKVFAPITSRCVLVPLDVDRAMNLELLQTHAEEATIMNVSAFESVTAGLNDAIDYSIQSAADKPVFTLIFGSFYMVEAAKRFFKDYE